MKIAALIFAIILIGLVIYTWFQGAETFNLALKTTFTQLKGFLPIIILAVAMAAFVEVLMPKSFVENWLSDEAGFKGILFAWAAGIVTPGAGLVGMPLVATLYRAGAGLPVLMTYITSIATLSLMKLPLEAGFYGWKITFIRLGVSLILPLIAGGLTSFLLYVYQLR